MTFNGGWVKMPKGAADLLPKNRGFSEIEALFSLLLDENNGERVSLLGYAKRWGWNRKRVRGFLSHCGAEIFYPMDTKQAQKQWGAIRFSDDLEGGQKRGQKRDRKPKNPVQIKLIEINGLTEQEDRKSENGGQKRDRNGDTSIRSKKKNKEYSPDSIPFRLSEKLLSHILKRRPVFKKPSIQKWAAEVELMVRVDRRDPKEIEELIDWSQGNSFWANNILSTAKLRAQFDKLALQMQGQRGNNGNGGARSQSVEYEWL